MDSTTEPEDCESLPVEVLTFHPSSSIMVSMNRLDSETRAQVMQCLVGGNSIRATVRIAGVAKNTITKFLLEAGAICSEYQNRIFRNLGCRRIKCNEIWSFVGAKDKNVQDQKRDQFGTGRVWTWTAIDADKKPACRRS